MEETLQFLVAHGYLVLFGAVLAQQVGLPLPSTPFVVAAGALAHSGQLSLPVTLVVACLAAMLGDLLWFELGRRRGLRVLQFLCRVSLEPDYCVRRTENVFARHGAKTLVFAKFIPGVSAVTTPLAGANGLPLSRFLFFDGLGVLLWIGLFEVLGYLFSDQLSDVVAYAARFSGVLFAVIVGGLVAYVAWKYIQRRRFLLSLRVARITPEELKAEMDAGGNLLIVDLRHALDHEAEPRTLPGALWLPAEDLEKRGREIPRGRPLVLYCT